MDCDSGYSKATLMPYVPAILQVPSNVTRIVRGFRRHSRDGKPQVIYYHSGVGAGGSMLDSVTGGMLGTGISENIREVSKIHINALASYLSIHLITLSSRLIAL